MARISFSDISIRNLPLPEKGQKAYWDDKLPGFGIRISHGGAKTFVVVDPRSADRTQETIGRYPVLSLQEARTEAKRRLAENTLGRNKSRSIRWMAAVDSYLSEIAATRRPATHKGYARLLASFKFKEVMVSEISPTDIQRRLDRLRSTPTEHYHAYGALRAFLNWAYRKHYLDEHPMSRMEPPEPGKPRERVLSDEELAKVWNACGDDGFGRLVKLLILTGQRRGEASCITKDMVGRDGLTFPAGLTKNGRTHCIPITPFMRELIGDGISWGGFSKSKTALDKASGVKAWTLHDLRRTFASGLAAQGVSLPVIEKLLNHISGSFRGIVAVYQRYDFRPEMKQALEKWEAHVLDLVQVQADRCAGDDQVRSKPALAA